MAAVEKAAIDGDDRDAINAAAEDLEKLSRPFAERRMDRGIRAALERPRYHGIREGCRSRPKRRRAADEGLDEG